MERFADLHIHTTYSDSTLTPADVAREAAHEGLSCVAITDHDTIEGIAPTREETKAYNIEVIAGVELSSEINGKDVHILGYLFDCQNPSLTARLKIMQEHRAQRMRQMLNKLDGLGVRDISFEEVCARAQTESLGRPHLALLLKEKGVVSTIKQAFDRYLDDGAPAYVPKFKQTPQEAIELIVKAGGVAVLAHPMLTGMDELIPGFVRAGMKGIEVYYPNYFNNMIRYYEGIAKKNGLIVTGGSDAHGKAKEHTRIGRIKLPYAQVEKLKEMAGK